jgi:hypothetical protein
MKVYGITWDNELSKFEIYITKKLAEESLAHILEGRTYDRIPRLIEIEVHEQYPPKNYERIM